MDLAVYIRDLLGLKGEVNVPGMGYFAQVRINGYYNEVEKKFFPPGHAVTFEPQSKEDDALAQYIANKKNISLASAKYFIDKYVIGIKQRAATEKVEIDGLGHVYADEQLLAFTTTHKNSRENDPAFYGFVPVKADKAYERPVVEEAPAEKKEEEPTPLEDEKEEEELTIPAAVDEIPPVEKEEIFTPVVDETTVIPFHEETTPIHEEVVNEEVIPAHEEVADKETEEEETVAEDDIRVRGEKDFIYDDSGPPRKDRTNLWVALLLVLIIGLLAVLGLYRYKPTWFGMSEMPKKATTDTVKQAAPVDTVAKQDTVITTAPPPVIDSAKSRFEVMAGSFQTQKAADKAIANYKTLGIDAKVVADAPGKLIKLTIGTFATSDEAEKAKDDLIKSGKVKKDIYTLEIKPKK